MIHQHWIPAAIGQLRLGAIRCRRVLHDDMELPLEQVPHFGREAAGGPAQLHGVRNDIFGIAGVDHADRDNRRFEWIDIARDDGLDRSDDLPPDHNSLDAELRPGGVSTLSYYIDDDLVRRCHHRPGPYAE